MDDQPKHKEVKKIDCIVCNKTANCAGSATVYSKRVNCCENCVDDFADYIDNVPS